MNEAYSEFFDVEKKVLAKTILLVLAVGSGRGSPFLPPHSTKKSNLQRHSRAKKKHQL
jgi:hypothetical protein